MITVKRNLDSTDRNQLEMIGLSTDEKPVKEYEGMEIGNGSTFYVMDGGNIFMYDEENHRWIEQ